MSLRRSIPESRAKKLFEEILKGFKDAKYDARVGLARAAWSQGEILTSLGEFLEAPDSIVRFRACFILAVVSQEEPEAVRPFVPKLIQLLRDKSYNSQSIRSQAVFALLHTARRESEAIQAAMAKLTHRLTDYDERHVKWYWP